MAPIGGLLGQLSHSRIAYNAIRESRWLGIATQRGEGRACRAGGGLAGGGALSLRALSAKPPSDSLGGGFVRREDLLKPDLMSEVILLGFGALIFGILLLILVAAWKQAPALV
jgi:hypothetical protein